MTKSLLTAFLALSTVFLAIIPAQAQSNWVPLASYKERSAPQYTTKILARLIRSEWDPSIGINGSKVVRFQLMLEGKAVGAMEMIANCSNMYVRFERVIPLPDIGTEYFDEAAMPYLQKAKTLAVKKYCKQR